MFVDFFDILLGEAGRPLQAALVAVALAALLENLMALFWFAPYYRTALPIFRRKIPVTELGYADLSEAVPTLEQHLKGNWLRTTTVFRAIAPHQLAFRYKFGQQVK